MNLTTARSRRSAEGAVDEPVLDTEGDTPQDAADLTPVLGGSDGGHPDADDGSGFDDQPLPPRRQKVMTPLSWVLVAGLLAGGGFAAGAHFKKTTVVAASAATAGRAGAATTVAGAPAAGGGGAAATGAAAAATTGTVKLVDGTNVYIQDNQGNVTKITTTGATTINVTKPGAVTDFKPGDTVIVQGPTGADGTVNATSISSGGGFIRGGGGAAGAAATTPAAGAAGATTASGASGTGARTGSASTGGATTVAPRPASTATTVAGG